MSRFSFLLLVFWIESSKLCNVSAKESLGVVAKERLGVVLQEYSLALGFEI